MSNALKFTSKGDVSIHVQQGDAISGMVETRFEVHDTGAGIPHDRQAGLFEKFTQADSSVSRQYGGSGLGLAICRELATALGGDIGVISTPGQGATFWFTVICPGGDPAGAQAELPPNKAVTEPAVQPLAILVAEDNDVNQTVVRAMLEGAGHRVDTVANGIEAIDAVTSQHYDVVLMD
ncbi:unnamed protein product, partial [Laminaria digitata]